MDTSTKNHSLVVGTAIVSFLSGYLFGIYAIRGYFISPSLAEERHRNLNDPVESEESDIDDDAVMDHAPNWANGREADRKQGLVAEKPKDTGEECKLVLVVRTDLGMTKGTSILSLSSQKFYLRAPPPC